MKHVVLCVALMMFCSATWAQTQVLNLPYGNLGPELVGAFLADVNNPTWGYPTTTSPCGNCAWPVSTKVGDIDNDGELDVLLCMEQRLIVALRFVKNAQGTPTGLALIWAWFDPTTKVFKHGWSKDHATIGDFDGDGLNEVAVLVGPDTSGPPSNPCFLSSSQPNFGSYRVALLGGGTTPDPAFGMNPRPNVMASWDLNSAPHAGWTCSLLHNTNGSNVTVQAVHVTPNADPTDLEPRELMISDGGAKRIAVLRYDSTSGTLINTHNVTPPWPNGTGTHATLAFDMDGDGLDEALNNGIVNFNGGCSFDFWSLPFFANCSNQYNHVDALQPFDHDGDGAKDLLCVQDCYDFLAEANPANCNPAITWENTQGPALHGQSVCIGQFIDGPDCFGWDAREALISPKGIPGTMNITGGAQWGYMYNGNSWELAMSYPSNGPIGPRDFQATNFDWDGDRTTDEIYSRYGSKFEIWRVESNPLFGACQQTSEWTPSPFPTAQQGFPEFPYNFVLVDSYDDSAGGGVWSGTGSNLPVDLMGDYREEVLISGRHGIAIFRSTATLANPLAHTSPWSDLQYRRRMQGNVAQTVNYQQLGMLESIDVFPQASAMAPGSTKSFQAFAVYSSGMRVDVTSSATFAAGAQGSFAGNVLSAPTAGLVSVQATVNGIASNNAALVNVTSSTAPAILYAGYVDTYLTASAPKTLRIEIAVADLNNDLVAVGAAYAGLPPLLLGTDDGVSPDRVANDGIYTYSLDGLQLAVLDLAPPAPLSYLECFALDAAGSAPAVWPYLTIGAGGGTPVIGVPLSPFPSETYGSGPPVQLAGTGIFPATAPAGTAGSATLMCRALPGAQPDAIQIWGGGVLSSGVNMNDSGTGADQIAGDGLWTGSQAWSSLSNGRFVLESLAIRITPFGISDAYPRLRSHP